jgi:Periplasmic copper-binding protein (NosD)
MRIHMLRDLLPAAIVAVSLLIATPASAQRSEPQPIFVRGSISTPGSYILSRDLSVGAGQDPAIVITASGVTLDLNGHEITGPGGKQGTGIMIDGARGVKVVNGNLSNLAFGVIVNNSNNVVLRDLQIRAQGLPIVALPPETAVMIVQSKNVVVTDNAIYNIGLGIFVRGGASTGNRIAGNTITAGTNGALGICYNPAPGDPQGPRGNLIEGNLVTGFPTGISISENSMSNVFRGNTIAYVSSDIANMNATNVVTDNTSVQLP